MSGRSDRRPDLREAMILVAEELLESDGPDSWTVREAARRAGVSSGAPYRHFADKQALLAAVAQRGFLLLAQSLGLAMQNAPAGHPLARLQALGGAYMEFALDRPGRYRVMFGPELLKGEAHQRVRQAADETFALVLAEVERAQSGGGLRADQSALRIAAGAWALIHGMADLMLNGRLKGALGEGVRSAGDVAALSALMLDGVLARPSGEGGR